MTSASNQVIPAGAAGSEEEQVSEEQAQLANAQQVLVALASGGVDETSAEVVKVNMYELLNNSVTFICEEKPSNPDS